MLITNNTKALYKSFTLDAFLNSQSNADDYSTDNNTISNQCVIKMPKVTLYQLFLNYSTKEIIDIKPLL